MLIHKFHPRLLKKYTPNLKGQEIYSLSSDLPRQRAAKADKI